MLLKARIHKNAEKSLIKHKREICLGVKEMNSDQEHIQKLEAQLEEAKTAINNKNEQFKNQIAQKPYKSVAIAAGAGIVIGSALSAYMLNKQKGEDN